MTDSNKTTSEGIHRELLGELVVDLAGERVEVLDPLDLVAEELDPVGALCVGGMDLQHLPADPEGAAHQVLVVAVYCIETSWRKVASRSIHSPALSSSIFSL